ncbi:hypothetical protein [Undibacterium sp. TJN19]|uniref:hypothetical protein n=1 Tax=Undibacterium sp. TJN19 TaxID=3413055 RepID=UPI003BF1EAA2
MRAFNQLSAYPTLAGKILTRAIMAMLPLMLAACNDTAENKTILLTKWLKAYRLESTSGPKTNKPGNDVEFHYQVQRQKKWWLFSMETWEDLDYDLVSVLNDKTILVARTTKLASALFGDSLKQSDTYVKLLTQDGVGEVNICTASTAISAPPQASFVDCMDASADKKRIIKRMDLNGKLIQTVSMDANQWEDLATASNVAFYDNNQQAYLLETAKDNSYCRLVMPGKEKSLSFALTDKTTFKNCSDLPAWEKVMQKKLSLANGFHQIGMNAQTGQKNKPAEQLSPAARPALTPALPPAKAPAAEKKPDSITAQ